MMGEKKIIIMLRKKFKQGFMTLQTNKRGFVPRRRCSSYQGRFKLNKVKAILQRRENPWTSCFRG